MNHLLRMSLVDAPFSSVVEYVADYLNEHPHLRVKAVASTTTPVEMRYELIDDRTDIARSHDAVALSWKPRFPLFPRFQGTVTARPHVAGSMVCLEGTYDPPGGRLGRAFDGLIGRRLAYGTMDHLLRELREYAERRFKAYRESCPSIDELNERSRLSGEARS